MPLRTPNLFTERLLVREITQADAHFVLRLTNEPGWLRFIGDKNVHSVADAESYIAESITASYEKNGFGIWLVEIKSREAQSSIPIGSCGLVNRDTLSGVDLGFAFLEEATGKGYAFEASKAVLTYAKEQVGLAHIKAITLPENVRSIQLLGKLQFVEKGPIQLPPTDNGEQETLLLFERAL